MLRTLGSDRSSPPRWSSAYPALVFAVIFVFIFLLHTASAAVALLLGRSRLLRSGRARHLCSRVA